MNRRKLTARDKKTQKMSRNGMIERNAATGEDINISKRESAFDIRGETAKHETLSQIGIRLDGRTEAVNDKPNTNKKNSQRHNEHLKETNSAPQNEPPQVLQHETTLLAEKISAEEQKPTPDAPRQQTAGDSSKTPKSREPPEQIDDKGSYTSHHQFESSTNLFADIDTNKNGKGLDNKSPKWESEQLVESLKNRSGAGKSRPGLQHDVSPRTQSKGKNKLKTRNNTAYQEQHPASLQHKHDSGAAPLKHQSEKLTFTETKTEQLSAPVKKGGKFKKRKNTKYNPNQSSAIKHEPPIVPTISETRHTNAANDITQNFNLRGETLNPDTLSQVNIRSGDKTNTRRNSAFQHDKPSVIKHEPQNNIPVGETRQTEAVNEIKQNLNLRGNTNNPDTLSQVGTRSDDKANMRSNTAIRHDKPSAIKHEPQTADAPAIQTNKSTLKTQKDTILRHNQFEQKTDSQPLAPDTQTTDNSLHYRQGTAETANIEGEQINNAVNKNHDVPLNRPATPPNNRGIPILSQTSNVKFNQNRNTVYQHNKPAAVQHEAQKPDSQLTHKQETRQNADITQSSEEMPDNSAEQQNPQTLLEDAPIDNEAETDENDIASNDSYTPTDNASTDIIPKPNDMPDTQVKHDKSGKLKFTGEEAAPDKPKDKQTRKLEKIEKKTEKAGNKLEKAKNKLPAKRKLRTERVFDEKKGKAKRKLHFEKEVKSQGEHLKGAKPLRPVKAGANALMLNAHRKIYQVEHENVAVKAAHRVEMVGEAGVRSALRHYKLAPYKKVAKLEKQAAKKTIKLNYEKALARNPKLKSNVLSRMWQKRKIKKQYAKAAREAKRAAGATKKVGSAMIKATQFLVRTVFKNPKVLIIVILLILLILIIMSLFTMCANMGSGGLTAILSSSYLAEDEEIEKAAIAYTEWETDLQFEILNAESTHPGYNEYFYNIGNIGHNPFELMAYLTAVHHDFSYDDVESDLQAIFNEQYTLTFTETTEIRYADPTDANEDGDYEPYEWKILTVTLTAQSFSDVIIPKMTYDQQAHYAVLLQTKGNRQFVGSPFSVIWLPNVTSYYGYRVHPITGVKDLHRGIDIALPAGTEIFSAQDGTVTFAGASGGYGNVVVIENENGVTTKYAHCDTILVSEGQTVSMGEPIATVGNTGDSTGAHLHFELLKDGEYVNPLFYTNP